MSGKKYGKAELRIMLFEEENDILTASDEGATVDVYKWFGVGAKEWGKDWEDEF